MGPNEKKFKKEYAVELFRIAENDLVSGKVLSKDSKVRKETVLFHVEQAVEKALKAALCHAEIPVPQTHDLYAVLQRFNQGDLPPGGYALHDLTPFATMRRYEEGKYVLTEEDVKDGVLAAEEVLKWVREKLKK